MQSNKQKIKKGAISELHQEYGCFGPYLLTKTGALIGAISFSGREPDGLSKADFQGLSCIARDVYQHLPDDVTMTQYYNHANHAEVSLKSRTQSVTDSLSKRRQAFLNEQPLTYSSIIHYFEIPSRKELSKLQPTVLMRHAVNSIQSRESRYILKQSFSSEYSIICYLDELERQKKVLDGVIEEVISKWQMVTAVNKMELQDMWAHLRFLANMDSELLHTAKQEKVPEYGWDQLLHEGDIAHMQMKETDILKLKSKDPTYIRMVAITGFGQQEVPVGMWASGVNNPLKQPCQFVIMTRFCPLTTMQKAMLFQSRKNMLNRKRLNILNMLSGTAAGESSPKEADMKPAIAKKFAELDNAEMVFDRWGLVHSYVAIGNKSFSKLQKDCDALSRSLHQSGFQLCWESAGLPDAWQCLFPAGRHSSLRDIPFNTTQYSGISLLYQSSSGQEKVKDLDGEEAQYVFLSSDRSPFYFSPFVGGRGMVFGVGPIRSGKSFTKNTLASHFMKYGGLFRAIDIDIGTEPVAQCFGNDGAIFRLDREGQGFNPFVIAQGPDDHGFIAHLKNLIVQMLLRNDTDELQHLSGYEQMELDEAIKATLALPTSLQRLSTVANHCSETMQQKLDRWIHGGMYGSLFDANIDHMKALNHPLAVFNLAAIKDQPEILPLVMSEIFYRITKAFESPRLRSIPKFLDIDEAHLLLKVPYIRDFIIRSVRTWGKYQAGISLWTQSPKEFLDLPDWPALRSAATTFFFMADPYMDEELYQTCFHISDGECDAIRQLIPKHEAYIIQPELGVSKKVILEVEPEQYVISTSVAREVEIRTKNIQSHGFEKGVAETIRELRLEKKRRKYA